MAERQETIADIIEEMRAREDLDGGDMVNNFDIYNGEYGGWDALMLIKAYADRLESAHRREREVTKNPENVNSGAASDNRDNSGDCAKLREALELCLRGMCGYCRMDAEARGMTTECVNGCQAMLDAKAALAEPMRNCDRFATLPDALAAWRDIDPREAGPFDLWLFAPAKEGGAE